MTDFDTFLSLNSEKAVATPATVFIYGLNDPVTGKCRYVGKAQTPDVRLQAHISQADRKRTHKDCWISSLKARGLLPILEVLDEVPASQWKFWEREYIRVFRMIGMNLTNLSDGGDGVTGEIRRGVKLSEAHRAKIGAAHRGKKRPLETGRKISEAQKGRAYSPQIIENMRRASKNMSPENRAKIAESRRENPPMRGKRHSVETRALMSAVHRARPSISIESRQKMAASQKERFKRSPLSIGPDGRFLKVQK